MQKIKGKTNLIKFAVQSQFILLVASLFVACADSSDFPAKNQSSANYTSSVTPLWETEHEDGKEWSNHVRTEIDFLGKDLMDVIPGDYATFCPKFKELSYNERKDFWIYLISQMARYESNFNPHTSYKENFSDSGGDRVVSRGLLQLSIESGNAYGCGFRSAKDVHDAEQNLSCGVRILNRWIAYDGRIGGKIKGQWRGGARYWSVLRSANDPYAKIVKATRALEICK